MIKLELNKKERKKLLEVRKSALEKEMSVFDAWLLCENLIDSALNEIHEKIKDIPDGTLEREEAEVDYEEHKEGFRVLREHVVDKIIDKL